MYMNRGEALRVMTFNLRYAGSRPPTWVERRPAARELLRRAAPHVIGTQEGYYGQVRDVAADLGPDWEWTGTGREGGSRGEFMAVFHDTRRLEPLGYDHFWLSGTPEVIGSNDWGGSSIRMVTWVRFRDLRTGGQLYVANTHLDNASAVAREKGAALLAARLAALDPALPRIVTGDFNVPANAPGGEGPEEPEEQEEPVYGTLLREARLVDAWRAVAAERRGPDLATWHGYEPPVPGGDRIDWILVSPEAEVVSASVNTFALDGRYPSDHLPVEAEVILPRWPRTVR